MEEGKLASRMKAELLEENLTKVCRVLTKLLDRDIFPWLDTAEDPTDHERDKASTIVADRLCSAVANPIVRNAQEQRQLAMIGDYLDKRGYRKQAHSAGKPLTEMEPATYSFRMNLVGPKRIRSAVGVELDPAFCEAARDLWSDTALEVVRGDFTQVVSNTSRPPAPNLILANPPYVRHHHMNGEDKKRLQRLAYEMTGVEVNGLVGKRSIRLGRRRAF